MLYRNMYSVRNRKPRIPEVRFGADSAETGFRAFRVSMLWGTKTDELQLTKRNRMTTTDVRCRISGKTGEAIQEAKLPPTDTDEPPSADHGCESVTLGSHAAAILVDSCALGEPQHYQKGCRGVVSSKRFLLPSAMSSWREARFVGSPRMQ